MLKHNSTTAYCRFLGQVTGALMVTVLVPGGWPALGQRAGTADALSPGLHTAQIFELTEYIASTGGVPDSYARVVKTAFNGAPGDAINMMAFEENRSFVYAVAGMQFQEGKIQDGGPAERITRLVRRLIILNSSIFVVDDEVLTPISPRAKEWRLFSQAAPQVSGREAQITEAAGEISSEILFPKKVAYQVKRTGGGQKTESYLLETTRENLSPGARYLQILNVREGTPQGSSFRSQLITVPDQWKLTVMTGDRIFRLTLPPPAESAGEISITTFEGRTLVGSRPLPSGILPHGPEGNRLLEIWDADYRGKAPAYWDIGRPADELQKVVVGGKVGPCRVVDLCCGSGTDAIYLAGKGFDVTALDVAPTALSQAQQKARQASVSVRWILADVLAPPHLKPFDFIYDRGCYHVVRDQNLPAYLETIRRFSRAGTRFLLLAARRDEQAMAPSGVTEEELRFDFLPLFDVEWLREIRLESNRLGIGPPGWSALLKRNAAP